MRCRDHVQLDDLLKCHQHLARAEPNAVQFLVLHHEFQQISDGDVQPRLGEADVRIFHVHCPRAVGCECSCTITGQANLTTYAGRDDAGRLGHRGDFSERRR